MPLCFVSSKSPFVSVAAFFRIAVLTSLLPLVLLTAGHAAPKSPPSFTDYEGFTKNPVLRVRVEDRRGRPVARLTLRVREEIDGLRKEAGTDSTIETIHRRFEQVEATTNADGIAEIPVIPQERRAEFRGTVRAEVTLSPSDSEQLSVITLLPLQIVQSFPLTPRESALPPSTLEMVERPDRQAEGFPVWTADSGKTDKILVLLEGFDLYNRLNASDNLRLIAPAADALRRHGISLLVVNYPDSHTAPDRLAPLAVAAIQAASRLAGGRKVAVAGLSMGGLVARWTLCDAEQRGEPLPVHTFLSLDTPNRGAILNPALQAMVLRYGVRADEEALRSDAARALLTCVPKDVRWKHIGVPPLADRYVPVAWTEDTSGCDDFLRRLKALGKNHGYPTSCRTVGVANSSRRGPGAVDSQGKGDLMRLWLPYGYGWTLTPRPADHAPGSVLPPEYGARFTVERPMGLAGSYLRSAPTFVSCESALDAAADEKPPFDVWFARPDGLTPLPHTVVDPAVAAFVVREVLNSPWERDR